MQLSQFFKFNTDFCGKKFEMNLFVWVDIIYFQRIDVVNTN